MQTILIILGIYLLYTFIADFAIPVYKTSKRVHEQFKNMQQPQPGTKEGSGPVPGSNGTHTSQQPKSNSKDYIDFEEV